MALSLALAESEIKRKQTESMVAELRQAYVELQKKFEDLTKSIEEAKTDKAPEAPKNEKPVVTIPRQAAGKAVN